MTAIDLTTAPPAPAPLAAARPARADAAWQDVRRYLRLQLGDEVFASWFERLALDAVVGDLARLSVPTAFLKSWLTAHYAEPLRVAVGTAYAGVGRIAIEVRRTAAPARVRPALPAGAGFSAPRPTDGCQHTLKATRSRLAPQLTFARFCVGRPNQLAHAAARRIAIAAEVPALNPLYLHGAVGLGKTHLLQAIAHDALQTGRRVCYLTAEAFSYGFVAAMKARARAAFRDELRAVDLFLLDDIQFLQGPAIGTAFCEALDAALAVGCPVVVAADRPPAQLEGLDSHVRSRLAGGLAVPLEPLNAPLRLKILEARLATLQASQPGFVVSDAVVAYVAQAVEGNGRDLIGAVNRLLAHSALSDAPLTVEQAAGAIGDLLTARGNRRISVEEIQKLVAAHYNVSRTDLVSARRTANVVRPRQIAMYLTKVLTLRSLPEIGRRFGGRDHTTVLHAVRKLETLVDADPAVAAEIRTLRQILAS